MTRVKLLGAFVLVGSLATMFVAFSPAQVKQGKTRPAKTKYIMQGLVRAHCAALGKALKAGPADDKAWDEITLHASLLNEASYILMEDGRCPDGTWANAASKVLRKGSADVLAGSEAKDVDACNKAFGEMTKSCGACHEAHKPKKAKL